MILKGPGGNSEKGFEIPETYIQGILRDTATKLEKNDNIISDWLAKVFRRAADPLTVDESSALLTKAFTKIFEKSFGKEGDMTPWREFFTDVAARIVTLTVEGTWILFGNRGAEIADIITTAVVSNMKVGTPAALQIIKMSADIGIAIADALTDGFVSRFLGKGQSSRKGGAGIVDAITRLFGLGLQGSPTIISPSVRQPSAYSGTSSSTVINNTYNTSGAQYAVNANYAAIQSPATISDDLRTVNMLA